MPRATKDAKKDDEIKKKTSSKSSTKSTATKALNKKNSSKSTTKTTSKTTKTKIDTKSTKKKSTATTTSKKSSTAKKTSITRKTSSKNRNIEPNIIAEYYDLPYRYNETTIKILYQTPNILFVYWDISDDDRNKFIEKYGENFFYNTKPTLKIYNLTKNYSFEIEINDFANSWYINVNDADCEYKVELSRKTINYEENINTDYIYISSSNGIEFPNDHILIDEIPNIINFKNVKTNEINPKDITTFRLIGINKIYNIHDFYKKFYKDEIMEELNSNKIIIPSSSSWN